MNNLVPASSGQQLMPAGTSPTAIADRARDLLAQPAMRKMLPWFVGTAGLGVIALAWSVLASGPQRTLYTSLGDAERAAVVGSLDQAGISYQVDNGTGALSVAEDDFYRARMLVAADGSLASPESGASMLENLPMGASRTLEGDRLRAAQERELELTIMEIDGVEAVRAHIAKAERSVFVREDVAPTASVMVRMTRGRQLADSQVAAIVNLVAASVAGLSIDAVKVVDQNGKLLTEQQAMDGNSNLDLQEQVEAKLRRQIHDLLSPMFGPDSFSSEVQVELDMSDVTAAREIYDPEGVVRRETTQESQSADGGMAMGVPGATTNMPPPDAEARNGAPEDTAPDAAGARVGQSSASRTYELGREVSVTNTGPGAVQRLSVAVAIDESALDDASAADIENIEELVASAVGAREDRGDQITVVMRAFESVEVAAPPFYETAWFATALRYLALAIGALLFYFLVIRKAQKALRAMNERREANALQAGEFVPGSATLIGSGSDYDREAIGDQIEMVQRIAREKPDDAVMALRRMLAGDTVSQDPA